MKTLLILLFATTIAVAQDINTADVPGPVTAGFEKEYPNAQNAEWEKSSENYKVEMHENGNETEVWYNAEGKVVKSEQEINPADLPAAVSATISEKYAGFHIDDCEKFVENNSIKYVVELEKKKAPDKRVTFDESGKVLAEAND